MISFYDGQLTDILKAHNITDDPAVQALSLALREGTRMLYRYAQNCYIYCSIDTAPENVVDLLAAELRTQYYDQALPLDTRRALVRNTLIWYMTAGTPAAVEELVAVVFGEGEVKEWYEYGAKPYWFKIITNAILTENAITYFAEMLRRVKNTRSHIGAIEIHRIVEETIYAGAAQFPQYRPPAITDGYDEERRIDDTIYAGGVLSPQYRPAAIIDGFSEAGEEITVHIFQGAGTAFWTHPAAIIDGFKDTGEEINAGIFQGAGTASQTRQAAILEDLQYSGEEIQGKETAGAGLISVYRGLPVFDDLREDGEQISGAIQAFTASNSRYSNTIKTE